MTQSRRRVNDHLDILESNRDQLAHAIRRLANTSIMVGVPSDKEQQRLDERGQAAKGTEKRTDTPSGIGNANIGYIHETGAPAAHIHARPWLSPGVKRNQNQWTAYMRRAGQLAFKGDMTGMDRALHAAGMKAVDGIKDHIQAGIPPPLSEVTIERRRQRSKGSKYRRKAKTANETTQLIDTAQFINSISYVIRVRRGYQKGEE